MLNSLIWGFAADAEIWGEFRSTVATVSQADEKFRRLLHYEIVAKWSSLACAHGQLARLASALPREAGAAQSQPGDATLADAQHHLQMVEASNLHHVALRINNQAGGPVTNGAMLQVLAQVMGNDAALWRDFAAAVEPARQV